jgi:hypothetical protein
MLPGGIFFEKTVTSLPRLLEEIELLDLDSGIRTFGDYDGKKRQFVFISRSPNDSYILMVYGRKNRSGTPVPADRLLVKEFKTKNALGGYVRGLLSKPVRAYIY